MKASRLAAGVSAAALAAAIGVIGLAAHGAAGDPSVLKVDNFQLADQNFISHDLYRLKDAKAVVLITGDSASVRQDGAALRALRTAYAGKSVELFILDSKLHDGRPALEAAMQAGGVADMVALLDYEQLVGEQLGVTRTGEALVISPKNWKVAYRGPVESAAEAIDAVSAGRTVAVAQQQAKGQLIAFPQKLRQAEFAKISYAHDIAPIIQQKCATCHQPGGIGPMPLNNYTQIKGFAPMIREVIRTKRMPPYLADETVGHFMDDDRLSPDQIKTLVHWVEAGAPRGTGADPLVKIKFAAADWPLGKPDVIVDVPDAPIPANGVMEYQRPVVKNVMTEGRWMKATTFRVSDKKVVHHILTGVIDGDGGVNKTATETEWGASLGGYGPGRGSNLSPADMGTWVPPSGGIAFQNHYTPYGKATTEKTQMGLYFYPKGQEPKYVLRTMGIFDFSIIIPPKEQFHKEIAYLPFQHDAMLYGITPHAHHRGASSSTSIRYPDGHEVMVLALPKYDFNWQYEYFLKTPMKIPAGSKVVTRWTYDNSDRNPDNPDSSKQIAWGEQSDQEMLATYLHYRWMDETVKHQLPDYDKQLQASLMLGAMDDSLDGKLQKAELKGKAGEMMAKYFAIIDKNKDGGLDANELVAAAKLLPSRRQQASDGIVQTPAKPVAEAPPAKPVTTASR